MRRRMLLLMALMALLVAVASPTAAQTDAGGQVSGDDYVTVVLTGSSAAHDDASKTNGRFDPNSVGYSRTLERMQRQHARFVERLAGIAPAAEVAEHFFVTANAVTVKLNGADPEAVSGIAGVERTVPSTLYSLDMDQSVGLINAPAFWAATDGQEDAGDGITVGVIDSGIDATHPFFACKEVQFGGVYASGVGIFPQIPAAPAFFGPGYEPGPGDPLYFSSDHGTHVAGTIGGCVTTINDGSVWDGVELSGVAPGVELWDYNVFPSYGAGFVAFGGSAFSHDIAAAIEDAVLDGIDVINMSLGGSVQGPHDFLAEASNAAVAAGVVVVTSAGNEGPGEFTVGSPGSASEVIAVGATTNTRGLTVTVTIDPDDAAAPTYDAVPGEFPDFDGTTQDLIDWPGGDNEACAITGASGLTGEIVLISRGTCSFSQKVANAKAAGAGGVIVYNNTDGDPIGMARTPGFDDELPAVMVSRTDGLEMEGLAPTTASVTAPTIVATTPNELAEFSSVGPVPFSYSVKPDLVAPGVNVLSSILTFNLLGKTGDGWELFNGTSMSSPHVAGAAAALLGEHVWTPDEVKSALVTTADAATPGLDVWHQGGGLLDLAAAHDAEVFFYPANASFGVMKGNKPANGSVDISISGGTCTANASGSTFVDASVSGSTLTVTFAGGRDAASGFYDGYVAVDCGSDGAYHIPWGAVVNR